MNNLIKIAAIVPPGIAETSPKPTSLRTSFIWLPISFLSSSDRLSSPLAALSNLLKASLVSFPSCLKALKINFNLDFILSVNLPSNNSFFSFPSLIAD